MKLFILRFRRDEATLVRFDDPNEFRNQRTGNIVFPGQSNKPTDRWQRRLACVPLTFRQILICARLDELLRVAFPGWPKAVANGVWRSGSSSLFMSCSNSGGDVSPSDHCFAELVQSSSESVSRRPIGPIASAAALPAPTLSSPSARNRAKNKRPKRRSTPL
jgi:hypothetical protein